MKSIILKYFVFLKNKILTESILKFKNYIAVTAATLVYIYFSGQFLYFRNIPYTTNVTTDI